MFIRHTPRTVANHISKLLCLFEVFDQIFKVPDQRLCVVSCDFPILFNQRAQGIRHSFH